MCNKILFASVSILAALVICQPVMAQPPDPESPDKVAPALRPQNEATTSAEPVTAGMFYDGHSTYSFQPYAFDSVVDINGCVYLTGASTFQYLASRVQLPQGARVHELTLYYKDNTASTSDQVRVFLQRTSYMNDVINNSPSASSLGESASTAVRRDVTFIPSSWVIDNSQFSYTLIAQLTAMGINMQICGARIGYTFSTSAPLVLR
jgi:hypothetical protein